MITKTNTSNPVRNTKTINKVKLHIIKPRTYLGVEIYYDEQKSKTRDGKTNWVLDL